MQTLSPDVSRITDCIFLSSLPKHEHADQIWRLGVRLVVSMPLLQATRGVLPAAVRVRALPVHRLPVDPDPAVYAATRRAGRPARD